MPKNVLIVVGSPRKRGNSAILARQVADGVKAAGARAETVFLHGLKINPCSACDGCRKKNADGCVVKDDMQALYPKMAQADAVVIAGPVYWFTVSAQTKLFMDRWYAFGGDRGYAALSGKRFAVVLAYGDADPFAAGAVNALRTFQDAFRYLGAVNAGMVYGSAWKAGEVRRNEELMRQAFELGEKILAG